MNRLRVFSLAVLGVYALAARGVGNLYPVSTFEMYGAVTTRSASRVLVQVDGELQEVSGFSGFTCEERVDPDPRACLEAWPFAHLPAVDAAAARFINRSSAKDGAEAVEIVRRIWFFEDDERAESCVLAHCRAVRR